MTLPQDATGKRIFLRTLCECNKPECKKCLKLQRYRKWKVRESIRKAQIAQTVGKELRKRSHTIYMRRYRKKKLNEDIKLNKAIEVLEREGIIKGASSNGEHLKKG